MYIFQSRAGLPVSHVILGPTDASVSRHKDTLLSLGRLAATVCSTAPRYSIGWFDALTHRDCLSRMRILSLTNLVFCVHHDDISGQVYFAST